LLVLGAAGIALRVYNHRQAKGAVLYFEEPIPEVIIRLGLLQGQPPAQVVEKS